MKKIILGVVCAAVSLGFFAINSYAQNEQLIITTYYPSPSGSYNELGVDKLAVNVSGDPLTNVVAVASEFAAMEVGDAHIGWSMIIGSGGGSGWAYDEHATTPGDGDLLVKNRVLIGVDNDDFAGTDERLVVSNLTTSTNPVAARIQSRANTGATEAELTLDTPSGTWTLSSNDDTNLFRITDEINSSDPFRIDSDGDVGIGLTAGIDTADEMLHLASRNAKNAMIKLEERASSGAVGIILDLIEPNATGGWARELIFTGTLNGTAHDRLLGFGVRGNGNDFEYGYIGSDNYKVNGHNKPIMMFMPDGKVGIGTERNTTVPAATNVPQYKLDVIGDIRATGSVFYGGSIGSTVGVTAYTKPDFVFKPGYNALRTAEVERFLKEKGHLPWMTSGKQEKAENGNVTDMTRMAFETVETAENLQLQVIELSKVIESQQDIISRLEEMIEELAGKI